MWGETKWSSKSFNHAHIKIFYGVSLNEWYFLIKEDLRWTDFAWKPANLDRWVIWVNPRNKELLLGAKHIAYHSTNQCGQWQKEEHCPPYKHWWLSLQLPMTVLKKSPLQLPPFNNTATNFLRHTVTRTWDTKDWSANNPVTLSVVVSDTDCNTPFSQYKNF